MPARQHPVTERPLTAPALQFDLVHEIQRLKSEKDWTAGKRSITLAKPGARRVVLMALRTDARVEEHAVAGALFLQVLEGRVRVTVAEHTWSLGGGELLALEPKVPHRVHAMTESVLLLTL